ncbi:MAG TPA: cell division protein SepF [Armatimonadota bacterium]
MNRRQELDHDEEFEESEGWIAKLKRKMGLDDDVEEDYEDEESQSGRNKNSKVLVRVHTPRAAEICVWVSPQKLEEIQPAADRLKERRPVIINLEHTDDYEARRVVDFISGVTYALDGYYQRVGEKVYVFTPSNTAISVEDDIDAEQTTPFFEHRNRAFGT